MIDISGERPTGNDQADLARYLREYPAEGYPVDHVADSVCAGCGGRAFQLEVNELSDDGARRICVACQRSAFIADSEDYWEEDDIDPVVCPCGGDIFEISVGFALHDAKDDVRWISVGTRCLTDGSLDCPVDWKINYGPSLHLLDQP